MGILDIVNAKPELTVSEKMQQLWIKKQELTNAIADAENEAKSQINEIKVQLDAFKVNNNDQLIRIQGELQALMGDEENIDAGMGMQFRWKRHNPNKKTSWKVITDGTPAAVIKKYGKELYAFINVETVEKKTLPVDGIKLAVMDGDLIVKDGKTIITETGEVLPGIQLQLEPDVIDIYKEAKQ